MFSISQLQNLPMFTAIQSEIISCNIDFGQKIEKSEYKSVCQEFY